MIYDLLFMIYDFAMRRVCVDIFLVGTQRIASVNTFTFSS